MTFSYKIYFFNNKSNAFKKIKCIIIYVFEFRVKNENIK